MRVRIFRNLGLKVLSIALATLVWGLVAGQREAERSLRVPLEYRNIPDQLELLGEPVSLVDVRLRGTSGALGQLRGTDLVAVIDLHSARPGRRLFHLLPDDVVVPTGVAGEICVGGAGVAPGYLNRPELTLSRFVPNPFSNRAGDRLYRSGDLARRRADGALEYLGRIDQQVKIRGFRIELGEIEATLVDHPHVREAVVLPIPDDEIGNRLVAVVVTNKPDLTAAQLQQHCALRLPKYMIPGTIGFQERLPKTSTGKVDRTQLMASRGEVTDGVV